MATTTYPITLTNPTNLTFIPNSDNLLVLSSGLMYFLGQTPTGFRLYDSTNGGSTWNFKVLPPGYDTTSVSLSNCCCMRLKRMYIGGLEKACLLIYTGSKIGFWNITDNVTALIKAPSNTGINSVNMDMIQLSSGRIWCAVSHNSVRDWYYSDDGGVTWTVSTGLTITGNGMADFKSSSTVNTIGNNVSMSLGPDGNTVMVAYSKNTTPSVSVVIMTSAHTSTPDCNISVNIPLGTAFDGSAYNGLGMKPLLHNLGSGLLYLTFSCYNTTTKYLEIKLYVNNDYYSGGNTWTYLNSFHKSSSSGDTRDYEMIINSARDGYANNVIAFCSNIASISTGNQLKLGNIWTYDTITNTVRLLGRNLTTISSPSGVQVNGSTVYCLEIASPASYSLVTMKPSFSTPYLSMSNYRALRTMVRSLFTASSPNTSLISLDVYAGTTKRDSFDVSSYGNSATNAQFQLGTTTTGSVTGTSTTFDHYIVDECGNRSDPVSFKYNSSAIVVDEVRIGYGSGYCYNKNPIIPVRVSAPYPWNWDGSLDPHYKVWIKRVSDGSYIQNGVDLISLAVNKGNGWYNVKLDSLLPILDEQVQIQLVPNSGNYSEGFDMYNNINPFVTVFFKHSFVWNSNISDTQKSVLLQSVTEIHNVADWIYNDRTNRVGSGGSFMTNWTDASTMSTDTDIKAVHVNEIRALIDDLMINYLFQPRYSWTDYPIVQFVTEREGKHWNEIRDALLNYC